MGRNLSEPSIGRRGITVRVPIEVCERIVRKFAKEGDRSDNDAFVRAIECALEDMDFSEEDLAAAEQMREENLAKRMAARERRGERLKPGRKPAKGRKDGKK